MHLASGTFDFDKFNNDLPINNDEKDPFIDGLERTMIATTFPIRPKIEMRFMKMPS